MKPGVYDKTDQCAVLIPFLNIKYECYPVICGHMSVDVQYTRWFLFSTRVCALHSQLVGFTNYHVHMANSLAAHFIIGLYNLWGLSMGVMVLYCANCMCYCPTHTLHLNLALTWDISTFPPKNSLSMIRKGFKLWGHWKCPHKSPSPCNTCVIPMSLYKFLSS